MGAELSMTTCACRSPRNSNAGELITSWAECFLPIEKDSSVSRLFAVDPALFSRLHCLRTSAHSFHRVYAVSLDLEKGFPGDV